MSNQVSWLHAALLSWKHGDISMIDLKTIIESQIRQARIDEVESWVKDKKHDDVVHVAAMQTYLHSLKANAGKE